MEYRLPYYLVHLRRFQSLHSLTFTSLTPQEKYIMIRIAIFVCLLLVGTFTGAQSTAGTISYDKTERSVAMVELPYGPDVIEEAIDKQLSGKGKAKGKEIKGFTSFKNPNPSTSDGMDANLYFRVESKRKEKNVGVVYLLVNHQGPGGSQTSDMRHLTMEESIELLNTLVPVIDAFALDGLIKAQAEALNKASKKYNSLTEDGRDLEKKKASIEKDIISNQQDQKEQAAEVELQKEKLAELLKRKKS